MLPPDGLFRELQFESLFFTPSSDEPSLLMCTTSVDGWARKYLRSHFGEALNFMTRARAMRHVVQTMIKVTGMSTANDGPSSSDLHS
eukprot:3358394-Pleurochrysis_carterae.AAC.1